MRKPRTRTWPLTLAFCLGMGLGLDVGMASLGRQAQAQAPASAEEARPRLDPAQPPAAATAAPSPAPVLAQAGDLATRFRFIEHYAVDPAKATPRDLSVYQVASRDTIKVSSDQAQGAPSRSERVVQIIYTERPAVVNAAGAATETVRHYDRLTVQPAPPEAARAGSALPLEGLTLWYKSRPAHAPLVMSLQDGRGLMESEYSVLMRQIFLPDLIGALPAVPSRVGDRWRVPKSVAAALLGDKPGAGSEAIVGTLLEVRPPAPGSTDQVAVVGVSGHAILATLGDTYLNAQILFTFAPAPTPAQPVGGGITTSEPGVVDAHGAITELRLARTSRTNQPRSSGRLKTALTWELILERRPNSGKAPALPNPPPTPTPANSWLTYEDPRGRFHFRHPQDFLTQNLPGFEKDDLIQLGDSNVGADEGRIITMQLQPKSNNPVDERHRRDPDFFVKELDDEWKANKQDVLRGQNGWLPDVDWVPFKMRVYHIEAAIRPGGPEGRNLRRIFLDRYVALFTQDETLVIDAMTGQDPPIPFRRQVEEILKTFVLGPSRGIPAPPGAATPAPPTTQTPLPDPAPAPAPAPASTDPPPASSRPGPDTP